MKVAVTGSGGGVGQSLIKALRGSKHQVLALDADPQAAGLYLADKAEIIPFASDPTYTSRLIEVCKKNECTVIFPGMDIELPVLAANRHIFKQSDITVMVSDGEVIRVADDKKVTADYLEKIGLRAPLTKVGIFEVADLGYPFVVKQKVGGRRSIGMKVIRTPQDLYLYKISNPDLTNLVAQEYIEGDEYTCGSVTFDSLCRGVIVMRRILRDGDTYKCYVETNPEIVATVATLVQKLGVFGAANVQLRMRGGVPYVFEINARSSGTTAARAMCGFNEPLMILEYLETGAVRPPDVQMKQIARYWQEVEMTPQQFQIG